MNNPAIQLELAPDPAPPAPRVPDPPAPQPPKPRPVHKKEPAHQEVGACLAAAHGGNRRDAGRERSAQLRLKIPSRRRRRLRIGRPQAPSRHSTRRPCAPISMPARSFRIPSSIACAGRKARRGSISHSIGKARSWRPRVAHTSGSDILDRQAVSIVKAGRYPPFPQAAFRGESRHSFLVTLEFRL